MNDNVERSRPPEEWKVLPLDETVQISSLGRVRRHGRIIKKGKPDKDGYLRLTVKGKSYRLHRLVAELFVANPNPEEYTVVDHINNKKDCNTKDNLRWVTHSMNSQYAADMGLQSRLKNDSSVVICWDIETKEGYSFTTVADCARWIGVVPTEVFAVISGKRKSIKGYKVIKLKLLKQVDKI